MRLAACAIFCFALAGCGYVGDTKPPTLDIPARVNDLRALQYGERVLVEFTLAPLTTEGLALVRATDIELRATSGPDNKSYQIPPREPGVIQYEFPASEWPGKQVALAVRATGPKKKVSDWSNTVALAIGPALAIPSDVVAAAVPQGVRLTWQSTEKKFRILRAGASGEPAPIGDSDRAEFIDTNTVYGTEYRYFVQSIASDIYLGLPSAAVSITPLDTFAPVVPVGLAAVPSPNSIELSWERNSEADIAGYNIFRAVDGGEFQKIAGPLDTPAYSDMAIESGKTYRYALTAMDATGNESARSMVAEALAQ